ncbi:MAG: ABC transporter ATP-binding protein [Lachnospirales bacterium]
MLLEMRNITKRYPNGVLANDNMNINLERGEVLAVIGENGAGKSTIMKILYGLERPTGGEIYINGKKQNFKNPQNAMAAGIGMVQQNFMLLPIFTVAENVVFGNEPCKRRIFFNRKKAKKEVSNISEKYGLKIDVDLIVKDCPVGLQQRCEILKVLYQNSDIIIFDEPTAVLTPQEVEGLLYTLKSLSELGKSIILITHKLNEVMAISHRCVVMRQGKHIATLNTSDTNVKELSSLMVGREVADNEIPYVKKGKEVLSVRELSYTTNDGHRILKNCSLKVNGGEIVGIAGISGNGQSELLHSISGMLKPTNGEIFLNSRKINGLTPKEIRDVGLSYVPEDRNTIGAALEANLCETMLMTHQYEKDLNSNGVLNYKIAEKYFNKLLEEYGVKYSSLKQKSRELSGGNLQKLIVAREVSHNSQLLIVSEPTRGVDLGAMEFIHKKIIEERQKNVAILLVSSDLTELLKLSDRVYVMYDGKIVGELPRDKANSQDLGMLMMGGEPDDLFKKNEE